MTSYIATAFCALGIVGLFALERDRKAQTSKALWIPTAWVLIAASRMVSGWLQTGSQVQASAEYLDGSPLDRFILSGLLAVGIIVLLCRVRRVKAILSMNWPILLFFSYCFVSILWSDYPDVAFKRWVKSLGDLVMILIVLTDRDRFMAIKRLLTRVGFLLIPLSVLVIEYYPTLGRVYSPEDGSIAYTGVTLNKNTLGMLCLVIGLASVWRLSLLFQNDSHRFRKVMAHGGILALVIWLLIRANSATSLVCFLLGAGFVIAMNLPGRRRPATVHLVVGAVASAILTVLIVPDVFAYFVQALGRNTTLTGRIPLWHTLITMNTNPWFGTGFASFWLGNRLDKVWSLVGNFGQAHNGYLEIFLNLGWVGTVLLALLLVTGYRNIASAFPRYPEAGSLRLGFYVVAVVYNFTEEAFRMMDPIWIFLIWAILAVPNPAFRDVPHRSGVAGSDVFERDPLVARPHLHEEIT